MIVGFSKHGTGASKGPIQYLTSTHSPDGTLRQPAPVVLRGDPALVGRLIDYLDFKHKYTSGVLSFAPGEIITDAMAERIMDLFELMAFAGLERDQYSILWVRHTHAGHHELNFLIPRVELSTGKSLNIAPPGPASRELFDTLRSMVNAEFGLADPEDVTRARDLSLPNHLARLRADAARQGKPVPRDNIREMITEHVRREVDAGRITDRAGVEAFLKAQGFTLTRTKNADYLSVLDPATGQKLRLRGGLYHRDRFNPYDTMRQQVRYGAPDPARAAELAAKLERLTAARAQYHQKRYGRPGEALNQQRTPSGPELPSRDGEALTDYVKRTLGDDAITPRQDGRPPARSSRRRRQRQRMQQAAEATERGASDPGRPVGDSRTTAGAAVRGPRAGDAGGNDSLARARGALEQASQRLERAGRNLVHATRAFSGLTATRLEELWWKRWYGEGRAR